MSFQCPSQKTNGSPTTSNLHTAPPPQQPYAVGQWNSGKPQIWCPYHEACRHQWECPTAAATIHQLRGTSGMAHGRS